MMTEHKDYAGSVSFDEHLGAKLDAAWQVAPFMLITEGNDVRVYTTTPTVEDLIRFRLALYGPMTQGRYKSFFGLPLGYKPPLGLFAEEKKKNGAG